MKPIEKALALDDLELDPRCQIRVALDPDTVEAYTEIYRDGVKLPPLDCFDVDGVPYLVDGFHRLAALRQADQSFARVRIVGHGELEEARWAALSMNQKHGLRRSNADKRRAIRLALEAGFGEMLDDPNDPASHRGLARHLGVSDSLVRRVRAEWEAEQTSASGFKATETADDGGAFKRSADPEGADVSAGELEPTEPARGAFKRSAEELEPGDPDHNSAEIPSERKPKKAKPSPFEVFRKSVQHVAADVPKFYEPGSEVHRIAKRFVELIREHEPTSGVA